MTKGCAVAGQNNANGLFPPLTLPCCFFLRALTRLEGTGRAQADWKEQVALPSWPLPPRNAGFSLWPLVALEREWMPPPPPPVPVASTKACVYKERLRVLMVPPLMSVLSPFISFPFSLWFTRSCLLSLSKLHLLQHWHQNAAENSALSSPGWPCCMVAGERTFCACTSALAKP